MGDVVHVATHEVLSDDGLHSLLVSHQRRARLGNIVSVERRRLGDDSGAIVIFTIVVRIVFVQSDVVQVVRSIVDCATGQSVLP